MLLERFAPDQAAVSEMDRRYDEGLVGSRELMRWDMDVLPGDPRRSRAPRSPCRSIDRRRPRRGRRGGRRRRRDRQRRARFPCRSDARDGPVSVGCPWRRTSLCRAAAARRSHSRSATRPVTSAGPASVSACGFIGTRAARSCSWVTGPATGYAAHHADVVFMKEALARYCDRERLGHVRWQRLSDVAAWVVEALANGRLPVDRASWAEWAAVHRSRPERFICGPEAWGEDAAARLLPIGGDAR